MLRECVPLVIAALCPGCSLILDFSDSAGVHDAAIDAVYTKAQCDLYEPNDDPAAPYVAVAGDMGPAAICAPSTMGGAEDVDYYKFTVATVPFTVGINFTNRPGGDLDIKVFQADGTTLIGQSRGFGDSESLTCPGTSPACPSVTPGDFVLEVFPAVPGSVNVYTLALPQ